MPANGDGSPGDLVLDPTCGSGTTAYVANSGAVIWITINTSQVRLLWRASDVRALSVLHPG